MKSIVPDAGNVGARLVNPLGSATRVRAVLFDLDGTLYDQPRMRRLMALELLTAFVCRPLATWRQVRGLREYRQAQETLRHNSTHSGSLDVAQLTLAAARASVSPANLASVVSEWMDERPLKHLAACRAAGLDALFDFLARESIPVGVFSDYRPEAKLRALGLADRCWPVLCASDLNIGVFKPDPRGFILACELLGLAPSEVLMVGDRTEVDGAGAVAAGMPCVIIAKPSSSTLNREGVLVLESLERLHRVLDGR